MAKSCKKFDGKFILIIYCSVINYSHSVQQPLNYAHWFCETVSWMVSLFSTMNGAFRCLGTGFVQRLLHSCVWHLGWDDLKAGLIWKCQPKHAHMAFPHGLGFSQHSSWFPGRIWRASRWKLHGRFWHSLASEIMKWSLLLHSVGLSQSLRPACI